MSFDDLGNRMKGYEGVSKTRLTPRTPAIIRLDGKAFHTLTRGMDRPCDLRFQQCMWETAVELCREVQGVRIAYTQSDEISLLLVDYQSLQSQGWFDYEVQKMVSVSAAIATDAFKEAFRRVFPHLLQRAKIRFDSRCFSLPKEEVVNYFVWRQQDAVRNSISSTAQAHFSHGELHKKSCNEMQEMLHKRRGINWNDFPVSQKRGACVVRRPQWSLDLRIPIFSQDRQYIERFVEPIVEGIYELEFGKQDQGTAGAGEENCGVYRESLSVCEA